MKKISILVLSLIMTLTMCSVSSFADSSNDKEMRAAWISTVYNLDWPKTKNNEAKQKGIHRFIGQIKKCRNKYSSGSSKTKIRCFI